MVQNKKLTLPLFLIFSICFLSTMAGAGDEKSNEKKICPSEQGTNFIFPKENEFRITRYDDLTRTYWIESVQFPGEGVSYVTPEALFENVNAIRAEQDIIRKNPKSIVRKVFKNDRDLPNLMLEERDARKGCVPSQVQ